MLNSQSNIPSMEKINIFISNPGNIACLASPKQNIPLIAKIVKLSLISYFPQGTSITFYAGVNSELRFSISYVLLSSHRLNGSLLVINESFGFIVKIANLAQKTVHSNVSRNGQGPVNFDKQKKVLLLAFPSAPDGVSPEVVTFLIFLVIFTIVYKNIDTIIYYCQITFDLIIDVATYYYQKKLFFNFLRKLISQGEQELHETMELLALKSILDISPEAAQLECDFLLLALFNRVAYLTALRGGRFPYPGSIPLINP